MGEDYLADDPGPYSLGNLYHRIREEFDKETGVRTGWYALYEKNGDLCTRVNGYHVEAVNYINQADLVDEA